MMHCAANLVVVIHSYLKAPSSVSKETLSRLLIGLCLDMCICVYVCVHRGRFCGLGAAEGEHQQLCWRRRQDLLLLHREEPGADRLPEPDQGVPGRPGLQGQSAGLGAARAAIITLAISVGTQNEMISSACKVVERKGMKWRTGEVARHSKCKNLGIISCFMWTFAGWKWAATLLLQWFQRWMKLQLGVSNHGVFTDSGSFCAAVTRQTRSPQTSPSNSKPSPSFYHHISPPPHWGGGVWGGCCCKSCHSMLLSYSCCCADQKSDQKTQLVKCGARVCSHGRGEEY